MTLANKLIAYLDCSDETSELRDTSGEHMHWLADDIKHDDWIVEVTSDALDEIDRLRNLKLGCLS